MDAIVFGGTITRTGHVGNPTKTKCLPV